MPKPAKPIENLAEALQRAYPELDAVRERGGRARLPGRRRRARPAARPRARRHRPGRRGRRRGARRAARRRGGRARALRHREGRASTATRSTSPRPAPRPTRTPARCPRWSRRPAIEADLARRDFTINAMAIPLRGEPRADRPPRRARPTSRPGCCASCTRRSFARRPDPGAARRALRGALRLRAGAGDRGAAAARPT